MSPRGAAHAVRRCGDVAFAARGNPKWAAHCHCESRRLLEPIGNIPPAEAEANYYAQIDEPAMVA